MTDDRHIMCVSIENDALEGALAYEEDTSEQELFSSLDGTVHIEPGDLD
jgi:hypothetical protein